MGSLSPYEDLVAGALAARAAGWDFGWLAGRAEGSEPSWSYAALARPLVDRSHRLLDVDTGGGEVLASLAPLPRHTIATEGWEPNPAVARRRLAPLGVTVVAASPDGVLPVSDRSVDLVLNRHGRLVAAETRRVLRRGGVLMTQQVGCDDCAELNQVLGAAPAYRPGSWNLRVAGQALTGVGFRLLDGREEHPVLTFFDIGAVVYQLRAVAWQIPGFTVERYDGALRELDRRIRADGRFDVHAHRFLIAAERVT